MTLPTALLSTAYFDSLPYIDKEPTPDERAAAEDLIAAEAGSGTEQLPSPPTPGYIPTFTPAIASLLSQVASAYPARQPLQAIDLSRYEDPASPDAALPAGSNGHDDEPVTATSPLHRLCAAHVYLTARRANLSLLDKYGPTAWLLANYHLEGELKTLEAELETTKRQVDTVAEARRRAQHHVAGELAGLEDAWRTGVERMVHVQVAVEVTRAQLRHTLREAVA